MNCENCIHLKCIPMVCHGVMDCDPPEVYCELDLDGDGEDCEKYEYEDYYDYMMGYDDYLIEKGEAERQEL